MINSDERMPLPDTGIQPVQPEIDYAKKTPSEVVDATLEDFDRQEEIDYQRDHPNPRLS